MSGYSIQQWLLFFYFYCVVGWVWESCYVSICQKKWVNRGFLHGPMLPLYGSGAVVILLATLPARGNLLLIFVTGMVAATLLEYFTGVWMLKMFHVRYWDYSDKPLNLQGHICLLSTVTWGVFSIFMVKWIHPPVERLFRHIPEEVITPLVLVLTAVMAVDATVSFHEALDLREMLAKLGESPEIKRLQKRSDVLMAVWEDSLENRKLKAVQKHMARRQKKEELAGQLREEREKFRILLEERKSSREYRGSMRILTRNPGAVSEKFQGALEELRTYEKERKEKKKKGETL